MAQQVYKVPRLTDQQIADALKTLATDFGPFQMTFNVMDQGVGPVGFPEQELPLWQQVLAEHSELVNNFGVSIQGVTLHYYRGGNIGQIWERSPVLDDVAIDTNGMDPARLKVSARILTLFRPIQIPRVADPSGLIEAQRAIQESTFGRLERQLERLFEQTVEVRRELDERTRAKEVELDGRYQKLVEEANAQVRSRSELLDKEKEELERRRKALDDSDNTFARRQIRERMLSDVAARVQNFGVSGATRSARMPVALGMALLIVFLLGLLLWTVVDLVELRSQARQFVEMASAPVAALPEGASPEKFAALKEEAARRAANVEAARANLLSNSNERIALWIRLVLASLGLVAAIIYYIRWQHQWAQQFAQTESSLQQFHIDVNRANWVVETCLEWRKETHSDIPSSLIDSMTRGLFSGRDAEAQVLHPADELASALMGTASKLSLDLGGSKVEIDKPQKIPKSILTSSS